MRIDFRGLLPALLALLLAACSSAPDTDAGEEGPSFYRYAANAEMSDAYVSSSDGALRVLTPHGWRKAVDRQQAPAIVLWLLREDYSASISFLPMQMDPGLYLTLKKDGIEAVAKVSLSLKQRTADDSVRVVQPVEQFRVGGRVCAAYEYRLGSTAPLIRVVVFDSGSRFVECALYPASPEITPAENRRLFEVQQSVLASMVAN